MLQVVQYLNKFQSNIYLHRDVRLLLAKGRPKVTFDFDTNIEVIGTAIHLLPVTVVSANGQDTRSSLFVVMSDTLVVFNPFEYSKNQIMTEFNLKVIDKLKRDRQIKHLAIPDVFEQSVRWLPLMTLLICRNTFTAVQSLISNASLYRQLLKVRDDVIRCVSGSSSPDQETCLQVFDRATSPEWIANQRENTDSKPLYTFQEYTVFQALPASPIPSVYYRYKQSSLSSLSLQSS